MLAVISSHESARQARQWRGFKFALGGGAPSEPTSVSESPSAPCSDATGVTVPGDTATAPTASGSSAEKAPELVASTPSSTVMGRSNAASSSAVGSSCGSGVGAGDALRASIAIAGSGSGS